MKLRHNINWVIEDILINQYSLLDIYSKINWIPIQTFSRLYTWKFIKKSNYNSNHERLGTKYHVLILALISLIEKETWRTNFLPAGLYNKPWQITVNPIIIQISNASQRSIIILFMLYVAHKFLIFLIENES